MTPRAWYGSSIADFLKADPNTILGCLSNNSGFSLQSTQRDSWLAQLSILETALTELSGHILFEFSIPRMGRRIDVVLLIGPVVFVLEFKVGESKYERAAIEQVWDYALDLKNFHEASHTVCVVPVLVATEAHSASVPALHIDDDRVYRPVLVNTAGLRAVIDHILADSSGDQIDPLHWANASYHPTPTIVEAARTLYAQHSVEAIARFDAGASNLRLTSTRIEEIIDEARSLGRKTICFVTGVPGAGKTLVGLNVATQRRDAVQPTHAVYLSGNGPLVAVLREALTRDEVTRQSANGMRVRKGKVAESVKAFIQNVHHFRDDALYDSRPPVEHVAIFDEAQRAWNLQQTANFMARRKKRPGFAFSEPEFLLSYLDRHRDWGVVICLVGGGQEINTGEAGIDTWLDAVRTRFPHWQMCISSRLTDSEYASGYAVAAARQQSTIRFDDCLHLAVSMRSFRAESVSAFVKALLDRETSLAYDTLQGLRDRYPIVMTRSLDEGKQWIRAHARGSERYGLVASSKAQRLKPHAIDIRVDVNPVHWFLNDKDDTRSSYYLEDAATEFQVQGLELDWTCVTWDADLRPSGSAWSYHDFRGKKWCNIANPDNRRYLLNAYRVLLTRARQGMVIFVPPGDSNDPTRPPAYYDSTYDYLGSLGIEALS